MVVTVPWRGACPIYNKYIYIYTYIYIYNCRVPKGGVFKGVGNWGTLRIPRGDWGTLGNIRED